MKQTQNKLDLRKIRNFFLSRDKKKHEIPQSMKDKLQNGDLYLQSIYPTPEFYPEYIKNTDNFRKWQQPIRKKRQKTRIWTSQKRIPSCWWAYEKMCDLTSHQESTKQNLDTRPSHLPDWRKLKWQMGQVLLDVEWLEFSPHWSNSLSVLQPLWKPCKKKQQLYLLKRRCTKARRRVYSCDINIPTWKQLHEHLCSGG